MNADKKTLTGHLLDMTDDQFQEMLARYGTAEPSNTASDEGASLPSRRELRQQQQVQAETQPASQGFWDKIKPFILPAALAIGVVWGLIVTLF